MNRIRNEEGVALVTSLMLTLISLTIVMALLLMVTQSIKFSGLNKRYKTALEASYGGAEVFTKDIFPYILRNTTDSNLGSNLASTFNNAAALLSGNCVQTKLTNSTASWGACSSTPNPKQTPDVSFTMTAVSGNPFVVYAKIVDTVKGNSDVSGLQLEGAGVAETNSVLTPQSFPYVYRLELQGERQNNPTAQANIEVLYAY
jgi:hypothetical protein